MGRQSFRIFFIWLCFINTMLLSNTLPARAFAHLSRSGNTSTITQSASNQSQGDLPFPSWWNGICDTKNYSNSPSNPNNLAAYTLPLNSAIPASYRGVVACGPRPNPPPIGDGGPDVLVNFFPGAFGEYEWECVELSMRYMYLAYGIPPYNAPGGKDVVNNYTTYNNNPILQPISNPTPGMEPEQGDILSYAGTKNFPSGHTSVVIATNYPSPGNGTIKVLEQNFSASGTQTLSMTNWTIGSGVTGWLHHTLDLLPQSATQNAIVNMSGTGFGANEQVTINLDTTQVGTTTTDSTGAFSTTITVPSSAQIGKHTITAIGQTSGFSPQTVFYVLQGGDWPTFGYNLQNTRYNTSEDVLNTKNVSGLALDWSVTTPGIIERNSSPIEANGIVYIGDDTNTLYAYNAITGNLLWTYSPGSDGFWPSLTVVNGIAYVDDHSGHLAALNANTGVPIWTTTAFGSVDSSPAVVNDVIYLSASGVIAAYDAITGSLIWKTSPTSGVAAGVPAIVNGVVYVASVNPGSLDALNAKTGNILWSGSISSGANSGLAVSNGIVYVNAYTESPASTNLYAFNASGCGSSFCSPRWIVSDGGPSINRVPAPVVANGVIYIGSSSNGAILYAFNAKTGVLLWDWTGAGSGFNSSAAVANGVVYDATDDGHIYAFKASGCGSATCLPLWTYSLGNITGTQSSPIVDNGMVYIGAYNGVSPYNGVLFAFHLPT